MADSEQIIQHCLRAISQINMRDVACLVGDGFGVQGLFFDPEDIDAVYASDADSNEQLRCQLQAFLKKLDEASRNDLPIVFMLSYEAGVILDASSVHIPNLVKRFNGPLAWACSYHGGISFDDSFPHFAKSPHAKTLLEQLENVFEHAGATEHNIQGKDEGDSTGLLPLHIRSGEPERHETRIKKCVRYAREGVLYQANLTHTLDLPVFTYPDAVSRYADCVQRGPTPAFAAMVDRSDSGSLLSLSPESFLKFDFSEGWAQAFPIKGTRPRGATADEDAHNLAELKTSEKDRAEHIMIVDLLRNDLGKVAKAGGVQVKSLMHTLSVTNVHHLESLIHADLEEGTSIADLLQATVPGGSISGAPKSAAIEVIHELEDGPRGPYTGNLGLLWGQKGAASILIRTWIRPDDESGRLQVGGGIVVDSCPELEWKETIHKAAAFGHVVRQGKL